jgi:hypothetical protein
MQSGEPSLSVVDRDIRALADLDSARAGSDDPAVGAQSLAVDPDAVRTGKEYSACGAFLHFIAIADELKSPSIFETSGQEAEAQ